MICVRIYMLVLRKESFVINYIRCLTRSWAGLNTRLRKLATPSLLVGTKHPTSTPTESTIRASVNLEPPIWVEESTIFRHLKGKYTHTAPSAKKTIPTNKCNRMPEFMTPQTYTDSTWNMIKGKIWLLTQVANRACSFILWLSPSSFIQVSSTILRKRTTFISRIPRIMIMWTENIWLPCQTQLLKHPHVLLYNMNQMTPTCSIALTTSSILERDPNSLPKILWATINSSLLKGIWSNGSMCAKGSTLFLVR